MTKGKTPRKGGSPGTLSTLKSPGGTIYLPSKQEDQGPSTPTPQSNSTKSNPVSDHPLLPLVQMLPNDLYVFLQRNFEEISSGITNLKYYRVLVHFNPKTSARPTHTKDKLKADFLEKLRPHLEPFLIDPPKPSTPAGADIDLDFDPLHRRTTRAMLTAAILSQRPGTTIASDARIDQILILYKKYVDPDLVLPANTEYSRKPKHLPVAKAAKKTMEYLRFALQCHAPNIFVHSIAMTHPMLVDLYIKFVAEEDVPEGRLVYGYHYSKIDDFMDVGKA
ncbi:uncharacterized protein MELLADRAFT_96084 [Melampsora larici-populina 98AG31]|uniref:Uncharacterized protein n=1 Tax=Melampsora larici-populina (strain 98AG31 / pathotype 3-4-7) TaxID=747676 RepID=F4SAW7_MELLP|nr:uncharacterized protein MELLADRAFT_96084 [Melampsora larici-populina 98AG31]EGF98212.1 hypothetical protein MELLADRAFT_96084 [Melampsora larici-populina 98AG31]